MSDSYYYLNAEEQPAGPMDLGGIRKLAEAGVVGPEVLVCPAGEKEWKPLARWDEPTIREPVPPLTPPPPRPASVQPKVAVVGAPAPDYPEWLSLVAMAAGMGSLPSCFLPLIAIPLAIVALVAGALILKQPVGQEKGFALAGVVTGALGIIATLLFSTGVPGTGSDFGPSHPSTEEQIVGAWMAGSEARFGGAMIGYRVRAEFEGDGSCVIMWGMGFEAAQPNDPRGTAFGTRASGRWAVSKEGERLIATVSEHPEFEMQANNGEQSFSSQVGSSESFKEEVWEFEVRRRQGDEIELFSYPPPSSRGYTFVRVE